MGWINVAICCTICCTNCYLIQSDRGGIEWGGSRMESGERMRFTPRGKGKTLHMRRRVPVRYKRVEPRDYVWISLKTDSEAEARRKSLGAWEGMLAAWEARLAGDTADAEAKYEAARDLAQARGFRFLPPARVAELPLDELVARMEAVRRPDGKTDKIEANAILGWAARPEISVSRALEIFWRFADDKTHGKCEDQIRRWRNPRIKAFKNFIEVVGDIPIHEITADDMLNFREWWWERIRGDGLTPNSANKDLSHLASVLREVAKKKRLGLTIPLDGLSFAEKVKPTRIPFSEVWIRERIIDNPALRGLNTEARCILLGMVNTGYRPSEGASLGPDQIRLDAEIPHISIEPNGRTLNTAHSRRVIPLAGISLEAFKQSPDGFPRYHDKPGLSATINKFMRENGMMESERHSLYGLRHSFEDRMLDRDVDERIRRDLMGHTLNRERYGKGASLQKLAELIHAIAL